jgi:hypothetical protein
MESEYNCNSFVRCHERMLGKPSPLDFLFRPPLFHQFYVYRLGVYEDRRVIRINVVTSPDPIE